MQGSRQVPEVPGWSGAGHVQGSRKVPAVPGWSGAAQVSGSSKVPEVLRFKEGSGGSGVVWCRQVYGQESFRRFSGQCRPGVRFKEGCGGSGCRLKEGFGGLGWSGAGQV